MEKQRIEFIDALRGLAILGVMVTHASSAADLTGPLRAISNFAGFGVQLFFVVSAFTIFLTYSKAAFRETAPVRNFFIRRLLRIVPVYWAGIVLYTVIFGLHSRGWQEGPSLWDYPFHITLTNIFLPQGTSSVVPGGWSISVEVMFYLTMPVWFSIVTNLPRAMVFTLLAALVGVASTKFLPALFPLRDLSDIEVRQFWYRSLPNQMVCFGFGMILFFALRDRRARAHLKNHWVRLSISVSLTLFTVMAAVNATPIPQHIMASISFLLLALLLSQINIPLLVNPAMTWIGRISYSAYILHFLTIQILIGVLQLPESVAWRAVVLSAATISLTLPAAHLSYRFFELFWSSKASAIVSSLEMRSRALAKTM